MRRRSALVLVVLVVFVATAFALVPAPASGAPGWLRPVPGRVVRPFRAPLTRYGRGHLGADFAAVPGTPVRAAGAGTVVFAGTVAHVRHVVVAHAGGIRTSYSFLASVRVRAGLVIERGAILGTTGGRGENHVGSVVHLGVRIGATFVDPMRLFEATGRLGRVHLAPLASGRSSGPDDLRGTETDGVATSRAGPTVVVLPAAALPARPRGAPGACPGWAAPWCEWLAGHPIRPG